MFDYTICSQADANLFSKQCAALENNIPGLKALELLHDVDGTLVQHYEHPSGAVVVKNDMQVDSLYVTADFDLLPYFN